MLLEGEAGTGAALNGEATAMGATPMVDRTGIMDEAAITEERTARTNTTPPLFMATIWASTPPWPEMAVHDCPVLSASSLG